MPEPQRVLENPRIEENVNRVCSDDIENSLERDPGKRPSMWEYNVNQMDEIRRAYLKWGPYQMNLEQYPFLVMKTIKDAFNTLGLAFSFMVRIFTFKRCCLLL